MTCVDSHHGHINNGRVVLQSGGLSHYKETDVTFVSSNVLILASVGVILC